MPDPAICAACRLPVDRAEGCISSRPDCARRLRELPPATGSAVDVAPFPFLRAVLRGARAAIDQVDDVLARLDPSKDPPQ